ncbi:hypothetical protein AVEN_14768-1 [Araneus ventricosus]|uniref:Uncharacterized protein n=1 Tax=Araneus ventricosus TaxID=182803 RepID=A0A4Y2PGG2_ARAVE|nr:hypothetical protein AVEN_14768-1 [Araneus ventricosus]
MDIFQLRVDFGKIIAANCHRRAETGQRLEDGRSKANHHWAPIMLAFPLQKKKPLHLQNLATFRKEDGIRIRQSGFKTENPAKPPYTCTLWPLSHYTVEPLRQECIRPPFGGKLKK